MIPVVPRGPAWTGPIGQGRAGLRPHPLRPALPTNAGSVAFGIPTLGDEAGLVTRRAHPYHGVEAARSPGKGIGMTAQLTTLTPAEFLDQRLLEQQARIATFPAEHGDPAAALDAWATETFAQDAHDALIRVYDEWVANGFAFWDLDDVSDDG